MKWTRKLEERVRVEYPTCDVGALAADMGISVRNLRRRANSLGVTRDAHASKEALERIALANTIIPRPDTSGIVTEALRSRTAIEAVWRAE